jgi:signal transduction histidine kinase
VHRIGEIITRDVAALRALLTDIYPPDLEGEGLVVAIEDLARDCVMVGVEVDVVASEHLDLPPETAQLAYRVVREGLRNVVKHARATRATAGLVREHDRMIVSVTDDGVGLDSGVDRRNGHLGLRLLGDTIRDLGGQVELSGGATGARLEASFPVHLTVH